MGRAASWPVDLGRSILALAVLALGACTVGPQYDPLDDQPAAPADFGHDRDEGGGDYTGVEGEAEDPGTDDAPPVGVDTGYQDDGYGEEDAGEGATDEDGDRLDDELVPGLPPIPRPGVFSPLPDGSPADTADDDPAEPTPDCDLSGNNPRRWLPSDA
jgi:hypothetical protein